MKLKSTLLSLLVLFSAFVFGAGPTITPVVSPTGICQGGIVTVAILTSDTFVTGNKFKIQLSDSTGGFTHPLVLDSVISQGNDTISFALDSFGKNSAHYRIRVVATNNTVGLDSTYLIIHNTPATALQLPQSSYCTYTHSVALSGGTPAGGVYSGNFVQGNVFQSYLSDTGSFKVYYTFTDSVGCTATDSETVTIDSCLAPSIALQVSPAALCPGTPMTINIQTSDVIGYDNVFTVQLSDSTGSFTNATVLATDTAYESNSIQISTPAEPSGIHYKIRVISSDPATGSVPFAVTYRTLLAPPAVTIDTTGAIGLCTRDSFKLAVDSLHGILYQWSLNGVALNVSRYSYVAKDSGLYVVNFTDTTAAGCSSGSDSVHISINAYPSKPAISPTGVTDYCGTGTVALSTPANAGVTFKWADHGQIISGATQNTYNADSSGVYLVIITSTQNCSTKSDSVHVNIHINPVVAFNLPFDSFCLYSAPIALVGGSPVGGFYSSPYVVNSSTFNQSLSDTGSFLVTYTYVDTIGCQASATNHIKIYNCTTTTSGIQELAGEQGFEMFPNPATNQVFVNTQATGNCRMKLFNLLGQEIHSQQFTQQLTYSVEKLPAGIYLVEISDISNTWKAVKRLVVR